ncbi:MAG TPA: M20/M25/M40 family metallo-hydrolase [Thermoanaerobaculia bacterium]|nr:M20/M25/M40 family metallo-hydrolase [Thermoanaerobaculia bacterium]
MIRRSLLCLFVAVLFPVLPIGAVSLEDELQALLQVPSVVGREEPAAEFFLNRLAGLPATRDALGNVVVTVGSGFPKRLMACPMGEPGYVVSRIHEDGYLRLVPASGALAGALWDQAHQGQTVMIGGARGWVAGAVVLPSVHLMQGRSGPPEKPVPVDDLWVDVGAESAAEVAEMGVRLLDAVALIRRPSQLSGGLVAAPSARLKGACIALLDAARRPARGTTVFAWTSLDLLNGKGLEHVVRRLGPFDEVLVVSAGFGWKENENGPPSPEPLPLPGTGLLGSGDLPAGFSTQTVAHIPPFSGFGEPIDWRGARVGFVGLPALYPGTPVETISIADVQRLADALSTGSSRVEAPSLPAPPPFFEMTSGHQEEAELLGSLIASYGVSGAEGPVREQVLRLLPSWAKPETDEKGNVLVTVGKGEEHVLFVAHMDEVGFAVKEIQADGRLLLEIRGGLLPAAWEAQAALVHGERGPVPGVFEPREGWATADKYDPGAPPTVFVGASSAKEAEALGIRAGSTVTMPKRMFRIGRHRVLGRAMDDRVGSTALLLALRRLDPAKLSRRVTFAWVVEEETGLVGSTALAKRFPELKRVHPVDTFVSSDSPIETKRFAYTPLGKGAVLRAMDNLDQTPRSLIDRFLGLAARHEIPIQVGMTGGASDGLAFAANGPEMLPFSWPGRYSHSPIEVADLRDLEALVRLVLAAATE